MTTHPHIVDSEQLRKLSGKRTSAAVRRWASEHGIRVLNGNEGPWTTIDAVNRALGVDLAPSNGAYAMGIL
jgi:hypothetical protein